MADFFRSVNRAQSTDAAESRLRELYGDVSLGGIGGYAERSSGDDRFAVSVVTLSGRFAVEADTRVVTVAQSTPGYTWRVGRDEGDLNAAPALFEPGRPMSSRIGGVTDVTTVTFPTAVLEEFAEAVYGCATRVRFDGARPASAPWGAVWSNTLRALAQDRVLENDLARAMAFRSLALSTLEGFRLSGDRLERTASAEAGLAAYRRATEFIDGHLSLPITPADVARAAAVSETELRRVFAAYSPTGWGPMQHLRRCRLAAAHLDLVNGDPTRGDTVTEIAARWGFTSRSRFAGLYRSVYSVAPKWVLDR